MVQGPPPSGQRQSAGQRQATRARKNTARQQWEDSQFGSFGERKRQDSAKRLAAQKDLCASMNDMSAAVSASGLPDPNERLTTHDRWQQRFSQMPNTGLEIGPGTPESSGKPPTPQQPTLTGERAKGGRKRPEQLQGRSLDADFSSSLFTTMAL